MCLMIIFVPIAVIISRNTKSLSKKETCLLRIGKTLVSFRAIGFVLRVAKFCLRS